MKNLVSACAVINVLTNLVVVAAVAVLSIDVVVAGRSATGNFG